MGLEISWIIKWGNTTQVIRQSILVDGSPPFGRRRAILDQSLLFDRRKRAMRKSMTIRQFIRQLFTLIIFQRRQFGFSIVGCRIKYVATNTILRNVIVVRTHLIGQLPGVVTLRGNRIVGL